MNTWRACACLTYRDGDPWSGHIGFPGGRREQGDSSDFECAIRETREELGIDVGDTDFYEPLGRLDDAPIPVARAGQRRGVLCAFVFLERPPVADGHDIAVDGTPELVLDPAEVSAVLWVPVSCLLQGSPARVEHVFTIRPKLLGVVGALPPRVLRLLGLHRAVYAAVDVFSASTEIVDTEDVGSDLAPDDELGYGDENKTVSARKTPVLWGLSMRAVSDMVAILGGNRLDRPPFVFGNRVVATIYRVVFFIGRRLSFLRGPLQPFRRRNRRIT